VGREIKNCGVAVSRCHASRLVLVLVLLLLVLC
jgi:hypothetical protein